MSDFSNAKQSQGLSVKLWRGERMCLVGMDVDEPEPDLVGFSIEVKSPGSGDFMPLRNRIAFSYDKPIVQAVDGYRNYSSLEAPFQKFRWVHFPYDPKGGTYLYRITKQHMPSDGTLKAGTSITLDIPLDMVVYNDFLDVGFARNFASSQAYEDKYQGNPNVIPANADDGLRFKKVPGDVYEWLGFEAYDLIMGFLKEVAGDKSLTLDFFAYDLNEPDIVALLEQTGRRLRAIIDNSGSHAPATSAESQAANRLAASAGAHNVKRMHFKNLQHNKVLIAKKNGTPVKVLFGSTNFSFRGIYIQANNALVFYAPEAAALFERAFELAFQNPSGFAKDPISTQWHVVNIAGKPPVQFCFSPHANTDLSLDPIGTAVEQATSSVFFSIAFLYQTKAGAVRKAIDGLMNKPLFSYGISDKTGALTVKKPDGSFGIVDFNYLAGITPMPFKAEWSGGSGIHEHHKFVVTDFSLPSAKVFTGSSNLSPSGEAGNGDNLVMIQDPRVATSYAIEALRVFDHLHFRTVMSDAFAGKPAKAGATKAAAAKSAKKTAKVKTRKKHPAKTSRKKSNKKSAKKSTRKSAKKSLKKPVQSRRPATPATPKSTPATKPGSAAAKDQLTLQKPTAISGKPTWFAGYYQAGSQKEHDRKLFSH
jgi:phosphatidylserine/phosphatidylglycerophosphate/cardiolipin synthase-like enzyme